MNTSNVNQRIVSRGEWQAARDELLVREKEHTRLGDELARQRRELPWVAIEKDYRFDTKDGTKTLAELFDGRSQLMLYHLQYGPTYEAACPVNSSIADSIDGLLPHLQARDITLKLVSQAPLSKLQAYRKRMGWSLPWVSASNTDFNFDLGAASTTEQVREWAEPIVDSLPPIVASNAAATGTDVFDYLTQAPIFTAFSLSDDLVCQTYATTARGLEFMMGYYSILDRGPHGRDEGVDWQIWIRRHDEYR